MNDARFLQIHTLTSYPASLLNRDDAGFAKRMPFGDATRTRISSQCLKRHWRVFDGEHSLARLDAPKSVRSRLSFEEHIVKPLVEGKVEESIARAAVGKLMSVLLGSEAKKEKAKQTKGVKKKSGADEQEAEATDLVKTAQVTVLGRPELDYLCTLARDACEGAIDTKGAEDAIAKRFKDKQLKKNVQGLLPGSLETGLSAALFGRMITGDILTRTDAAIHVAHAMTVHAQQSESDYFSAIDELAREEGEQGSGHINASELTSGLFYGYVVVDLRQLLSNLGDDRPLAGAVLNRLVRMVATVSPGAKLGSTAPYAYSHLVLTEAGRAQPRTLANAFLSSVPTRGDIVQNAYLALHDHIADLDEMYGSHEERTQAGLRTGELFPNKRPLDGVALLAEQLVHPEAEAS